MNKWTIWVNYILLIIFVVCVPFFCFDNEIFINISNDSNNTTQVLELWHIETFEGGSASRELYIKRCAIAFEKLYKNKLIIVKTINPENIENALTNAKPDMISFGFGVGDIILKYLKPLDKQYKVRDDLLQSAMVNSKQMAIPFILSGYVFITSQSKTLDEWQQTNEQIYTQNIQYTNAEYIYKQQPINNGKLLTAYQAYNEFVQNKAKILLGTSRDLYRVNNLIEKGKISASFNYINHYSDLVQYIGIINKNIITQNFVEFLLTDKIQIELNNYCLYTTKSLSIYTRQPYVDMENALSNNLFVPKVFKGKQHV